MGISPFGNSYRNHAEIDHKTGYAPRIIEKVREIITRVPAGTPDPRHFEYIRSRTTGRYLIVELRYLDCRNYQGRKVLVYKDMTIEKLMNGKFIDPHFCDYADCISPIARFEPTEHGWDLAVKFCDHLFSKRHE